MKMQVHYRPALRKIYFTLSREAKATRAARRGAAGSPWEERVHA